jgi:hypothetical protein
VRVGVRLAARLSLLAAFGLLAGASSAQNPPAGTTALPGDAILDMMEGIWGERCDRGAVMRQIIRMGDHIMVHREARTTLEIVTAINGNVVDTCAVEGNTTANECFRYTVLPDRIIADYLARGIALWERCDPPRA